MSDGTWWYCHGIQEVWGDKPDDCGDPGSFHQHDRCGPVRLIAAKGLPAAPDFVGTPGGVDISNFPRTGGHLTECLLVHKKHLSDNYPWCNPPDPRNTDDYCTCDDWSPEQ